MGLVPRYDDHRDPFNSWLSRAGPLLLVALIASIVVLQQVLRNFEETTLSAPTAERSRSEEITQPGIAELTLTAKRAVRMARLSGGPSPEEDAEDDRDSMDGLDLLAETRVDRLRVAIVAGELLGRQEAVQRLSRLQQEVEPDEALASDIYWLLAWYDPDSRDQVPQDATAALVGRHGWFARLALVHDAPDDDRRRQEVVGGGDRLVALVMGIGLVALAMAFVSVIFLVGVILSLRRREWSSELESTELPGGLYLEIVLIFLIFFTSLLGLQIATLWLTGPASVAGMAIGQVLLWTIPLVLFWPRLRGLEWRDLATDLGWSRGASAVTEMKAGLMGYLASLPLVFGIGWAGSAIEAAVRGHDEAPGYSPFQPVLAGSWIPVVLGTLSAVLWAPIVEEILFRGALYRSLRGRMGPWLAVPISALIFGAVHPYSTAGLVSVAAAGVIFALLREWRGSLIAPMTAHFLHNGTLSLLSILLVLAVD